VVDGDTADGVDGVSQERGLAGAGVDAMDCVAGADVEGVVRDGGRLAGGKDAVAGEVRAGWPAVYETVRTVAPMV
jgi:hypothetical protein